MLGIVLDLTPYAAYLQRPDLILLKALPWVGGFIVMAVIIWGIFEIWLFNRQHHFRHSRKYVLLSVAVPKMTEQSPKGMESVFTAIASSWGGSTFKEHWIDGEMPPVFSFEIVSDGGIIQFYIRCETKFRDMIESSIYAHYPDAEISEAEDYTHMAPHKFPNEEYQLWGIENKLKKPNWFPIRTYEDFEHKLSQELKDPLGVLLENYGRLKPGEHMWSQFLISPLGEMATEWIKPGVKYIYSEVGKEEKGSHKSSMMKELVDAVSWIPGGIMEQLGGGLFGGGGDHHEESAEDPWKFLRSTPIDKARLDLVTKKLSKPGLNVKIRHVYLAKHEVFNKGPRDKMMSSIFNQFSYMDSNLFGRVSRVTPKNDYFWQAWYTDKKRNNLIHAYSHRDEEIGGGHFILNVEEMATLWHFPAITVRAPFVTKTIAKRAEPPVQLPIEEIGGPDPFASAAGSHHGSSAPTALPVEIVEPVVPGQSSSLRVNLDSHVQQGSATATEDHVAAQDHGHHPSQTVRPEPMIEEPALPQSHSLAQPSMEQKQHHADLQQEPAAHPSIASLTVDEPVLPVSHAPTDQAITTPQVQQDHKPSSQVPDAIRALFDPDVEIKE